MDVDLTHRYKEFDMAHYEDLLNSLRVLPVEEKIKYRELVEPLMEKVYLAGRDKGIIDLEAKLIGSDRRITRFDLGKYEDEFVEILIQLYITEKNLILTAFNLRNLVESAYIDGQGYAIRNFNTFTSSTSELD